ncbi:MAG: sensor histidine kinase, partial [Candidatus Rokuibacteriota bacterium]
ALTNARLASRQRAFADELADKVAAATHRLEEADRAKSTFVAMASHELRTPLTALKGFAELLAVRTFPPVEVRRLAGIMCREIDRLARIVSDLLDLSRLERGVPPALCRTPVAVEAALASAVALLQRTVPAREILVECEPGLPAVDADPDALDRIVKNLVGNAIKYSGAGDAIRVGARRAPGRDGVEFSVEDRGRGIPAEALPHVFEPYYRAADAVGAAHGEGIGLAVVKGLVEAHGGAIALASAPTVGTRVSFVLPVAVPAPLVP